MRLAIQVTNSIFNCDELGDPKSCITTHKPQLKVTIFTQKLCSLYFVIQLLLVENETYYFVHSGLTF